jgi:hypothetical protein
MSIYAFYHHRACLSLDSVYLSLAFPSLNFLRIVIWWESISHRWMDFCLKILRIREIARLSTRAHHREGNSPRWAEISLYYNHDLTIGVQRACEVRGSHSSGAENTKSYEMWCCPTGQVVALHFEGSYCLNLRGQKDKKMKAFFLSLSQMLLRLTQAKLQLLII